MEAEVPPIGWTRSEPGVDGFVLHPIGRYAVFDVQLKRRETLTVECIVWNMTSRVYLDCICRFMTHRVT